MGPAHFGAKRRLGAFLGVYTPTTLTILGVILYLRFGWVVGSVGLFDTLVIVVLANGITLITTLSFSAVATNTRVGVGGAYNIVSRSLGLETGGAIGVPLFLSQALSVTLYSYGLAESIQGLIWSGLPVPVGTAVIILLVALLAFRGANLALAVQIPLLALIAVSIAGFAYGALTKDPIPFAGAGHAVSGPGFWAVFAVFFPAVTGIMAGLGLSGDLKDPVRAIPRGALAAVLTGLAVYLVVPILLARAAAPEALASDPLIWTRIAPIGALIVLPALWGAIFSSAVGSILGAPRTLQALAMDGLAPRRLARVGAGSGEPLAGLAVTVAIALGAVFLGNLNAVATVVSMFFLTIYGTMNFVAALETLAGDPSWRPKLRLPWPLSLAGGLACLFVMLLISPAAAGIAVLLEILLWLALARRELKADWGDVRRGAYETLIRWSLVRLNRHPMTARSWRPHVLVFADDVERRIDLVRYASWFTYQRGIVSVCELVVGDVLDRGLDRATRQRRIAEVLTGKGIVAFPEVDVVPEVITGIGDVAQANGIAGMESNTILIGWPKEAERLADFLRVMRILERLNKSFILGNVGERWVDEEGDLPLIHVWWGGLQRNGDLMILLAYLLTKNPQWRHGRIRLMSIATEAAAAGKRAENLKKLIAESRIPAEPRVSVLPEGRTVVEVIHEESACADAVFLGLDVPAPGHALEYAERLMKLSEGLRNAFFVKNASLFPGDLL